MSNDKLKAIHAVFLGLCRSQVLDPVLDQVGCALPTIQVVIDGKLYRINLTQVKGA